MKKRFDILFSILAVILLLGSMVMVAACDWKFESKFEKEIYTDRLFVLVNAESKEKFIAQEFTPKDFVIDNIKGIEYYYWYDELNASCWYIYAEGGFLIVYLKSSGEFQLEQSKACIEKLEFVREVSYLGRFPINERKDSK